MPISLPTKVISSFLIGMGLAGDFPAHPSASPNQAPVWVASAEPGNSPLPAAFFSLNIVNLEYGAAWPTVPFHGWRNFHSIWPKLEPEKGHWDFAQLDRDVEQAEQHRVEMMLVLQLFPAWAEDGGRLTDWQNYVRTVATRYKGRVKHYELWNEPNVKRFFPGTVEQLVALNQAAYRILKEVDSSNTVLSSAMSADGNSLAYLDEYLAKGGGTCADAIGYHFYTAPRPPETMLPRIGEVKALLRKHGLLDKPLWNTESGWNIVNDDQNLELEAWAGPPLDEPEASAYLARAHLIAWAGGVERFYWYAWGHRRMGMTDYDLKTVKPIAQSYEEIQRWTLGASLKEAILEKDGSWRCHLSRNGTNDWILWHPSRTMAFHPPTSWRVGRVRKLTGEVSSETSLVEIGPSPVLLEEE